MYILTCFIGGLVFFLYGQQLLERALQKTSRFRLQRLFQLLTSHKFAALLLGSLFAIGTQSSTAAVTTLVSIVNAGLLRLPQAVGMLLGASIGSTIMVQVIAFRVANYGLLLVAVGFILSRVYGAKWSAEGKLLFGLGLMFYGISLMGQGISIFKETTAGASFLHSVCSRPAVSLIASFFITLICQSTLVPLAVGITLVQDGGLPLVNVLPVILGSHLGASILPLVASWKSNRSRAAKQLAWANFGYRFFSAVIFLPLLVPWAALTGVATSVFIKDSVSSGRLLANAHTIFTLFGVMLFLPLTRIITAVLLRLIPEKEPEKKILRYLSSSVITSPEQIVAAARKELSSLADQVQQLFNRAMEMWEKDSFRQLINIEIKAKKNNLRQEAFSRYLTKLPRSQMPADWAQEELRLLGIAHNVQKINNAVSWDLLRIFKNKISQGANFSIEGLNELLTMHKQLMVEMRMLAVVLGDKDEGQNIAVLRDKIDALFRDSHLAHIERLHRGFPETRETSSLHLEAVTVLEHIHGYLLKIFDLLGK